MYDLTQAQIKDLAYFDGHVEEFLADNNLRFKHVIIADCKIAETFDGLDLAVNYARDNLQRGEYIISQVVNDDEIVNFV
jgi:hypothetical protein